MEFISQAVTVLQTLVIALGAGLAVNASRFCSKAVRSALKFFQKVLLSAIQCGIILVNEYYTLF